MGVTPESSSPNYFEDEPTQAPSISWHADSAPGSNGTAPDFFESRDDGQPVAPVRGPREPWWRRPWWLILAGLLVVAVAMGAPVFLGALRGPAAPTNGQTAVPQATPSVAVPSGATSAEPIPVEPTPTGTAEPSTATVAPRIRTALAAIDALKVGGEDPWNYYSRAAFGQAWADEDRNGCDQRNDVLSRDLEDVVYRPGTRNCVVERGIFHDPYSGTTIDFERGPLTSLEVQIDHVVPLADAWHKGAQDWSAAKREAFANDLLNLMASKGAVNQVKSAQDASEWLPPNHGFGCAYVARQVAVKVKYGLRVTAKERGAMIKVLSQCPGESLPEE